MNNDQLIVVNEPPLVWLAINRPAARNALNLDVWRAIGDAVCRISNDPDSRVIMIRGAGDHAFISGADIAEFPSNRSDANAVAEYDRIAHGALKAIIGAPQPVVAMVNGICYGGGVLLSLVCDLRFAGDHARFSIPAAKLGLAYTMELGVERLVRIVGPTNAADILLSGRSLDAEEALRMGMLNRVVPRADLEKVTREYALTVAERAPLSLAAHKLEIQQTFKSAPERDLERIKEAASRCFNSEDYKEGIAAFLEKRKPRFHGR
jgi:enoyl-CoA hydratase/carnithine racemase